MGFGTLAVAMFFVVSGFLITKSWNDSPKPLWFIKKRLLRIMPGFIGALLFVALVVGPLVSYLSPDKYFSDINTYTYLKNIFMFGMRDSLPGVFLDNPYPIAVNGSLWTLPIEMLMYLVVLIFGVTRLLTKRFSVLALVAILLILYFQLKAAGKYETTSILSLPLIQMVMLSIYFFIGSAFYLFNEFIRMDFRLFLVSLGLFFGTMRTPVCLVFSFFVIPYMVFYIAYLKLPAFLNIRKFGDFSYGLYIFAFPVQQTIMHIFGVNLKIYWFFLLSFLCTLVLAILSWHFIESPMLKLKNKPLLMYNAKIRVDKSNIN